MTAPSADEAFDDLRAKYKRPSRMAASHLRLSDNGSWTKPLARQGNLAAVLLGRHAGGVGFILT
jgi:hypothetical protein